MGRFLLISILLVLYSYQTDRYSLLRIKMVEEQIKARGITDINTLKAMELVPRHKFVPLDQIEYAYNDYPLNIGFNQTISQPYIVAYMTEALELKKNHKILEVGTGSGYQAAILSEIVDLVYSIEIIKPLGEEAKQRLQKLGYSNVHVKIADGYKGWSENAPYDGIIVTAAPETIPTPLVEQLKEGGKMIIPVGSPHYTQKLMLIEKKNNNIVSKNLIPVRFVPFTRTPD